MSTKDGPQQISIAACRNIFFILEQRPQTPFIWYGMMVWPSLECGMTTLILLVWDGPTWYWEWWKMVWHSYSMIPWNVVWFHIPHWNGYPRGTLNQGIDVPHRYLKLGDWSDQRQQNPQKCLCFNWNKEGFTVPLPYPGNSLGIPAIPWYSLEYFWLGLQPKAIPYSLGNMREQGIHEGMGEWNGWGNLKKRFPEHVTWWDPTWWHITMCDM